MTPVNLMTPLVVTLLSAFLALLERTTLPTVRHPGLACRRLAQGPASSWMEAPSLRNLTRDANTLKPTTPLRDGRRSIRYTVTNSAGLVSAQSDPLEVTIDSTAPGN